LDEGVGDTKESGEFDESWSDLLNAIDDKPHVFA
jgi:hypothetical protein